MRSNTVTTSGDTPLAERLEDSVLLVTRDWAKQRKVKLEGGHREKLPCIKVRNKQPVIVDAAVKIIGEGRARRDDVQA